MQTLVDHAEGAADECWLDDCGLVHLGKRWVALPDVEWRLMLALLDRRGLVVRREDLIAAAWPGQTVKPGVLNVRIGR
jgi:DNA-binding winged helix-turn-helix (wHTH) protein